MSIENTLMGKIAMYLIYSDSFLRNFCIQQYFQNV